MVIKSCGPIRLSLPENCALSPGEKEKPDLNRKNQRVLWRDIHLRTEDLELQEGCKCGASRSPRALWRDPG